jgi:hypothetical protein
MDSFEESLKVPGESWFRLHWPWGTSQEVAQVGLSIPSLVGSGGPQFQKRKMGRHGQDRFSCVIPHSPGWGGSSPVADSPAEDFLD